MGTEYRVQIMDGTAGPYLAGAVTQGTLVGSSAYPTKRAAIAAAKKVAAIILADIVVTHESDETGEDVIDWAA